MKFSLAVLSAALCMSCAITKADSGQKSQSLSMFKNDSVDKEHVERVSYRFLLSLPEGYEADAQKKWPLVVFLHGAGERGDNLELLLKHGPPKLVAAGKKFEAIVASPQVPAGEVWNVHGVKALVDKLSAEYRVDASRIYLTGISMGGFGTWATILEYPNVFAAAAPICGGAGIGILKFDRIKDLPIWVFHGGADTVVPPEYSTSVERRLKNHKHFKITIYPDVGHDSWTQTYDNAEFWDWLFAQKRG